MFCFLMCRPRFYSGAPLHCLHCAELRLIVLSEVTCFVLHKIVWPLPSLAVAENAALLEKQRFAKGAIGLATSN